MYILEKKINNLSFTLGNYIEKEEQVKSNISRGKETEQKSIKLIFLY